MSIRPISFWTRRSRIARRAARLSWVTELGVCMMLMVLIHSTVFPISTMHSHDEVGVLHDRSGRATLDACLIMLIYSNSHLSFLR